MLNLNYNKIPTHSSKGNIVTRSLVGLIGIPLLLAVPFAGINHLTILITIISFLASRELMYFFQKKGLHVNLFLPIYTAIIPVCMLIVNLRTTLGIMVAIMILLFIVEIFRNSKSALLSSGAYLLSLFYCGLFPASLINILDITKDPKIIIIIFCTIWGTDSFAYFGGMLCSKLSFYKTHKLLEKVSPKKTIEGAICGIIFGSLIAFWVYYLIKPTLLEKDAIVIIFTTTLIGQVGDLFESLLKRDCGIKDSSNIIPGHGGILDRFDSLIFVAPIIALYLNMRLRG